VQLLPHYGHYAVLSPQVTIAPGKGRRIKVRSARPNTVHLSVAQAVKPAEPRFISALEFVLLLGVCGGVDAAIGGI